jgi:hypothetical protein
MASRDRVFQFGALARQTQLGGCTVEASPIELAHDGAQFRELCAQP